jgi:phosphonate transport system ATP-binding protein
MSRPPPTTNPIVRISEATKVFAPNTMALDGVDLEVRSGQFVVVLGPSGSGKSTLLRSVNGLERLTSGHIEVCGLELIGRNLRAIRNDVSMIFQHFNLVKNLSVMTNVLCGCLGRLNRLETVLSWLYLFDRRRMEAARQLLNLVGLADRQWQRADTLSGGQQQRVGIARALMQEPQVLLADEPVASLDPVTGKEVMDLLHRISRQRGLTVIASLHQVDLARTHADRVVGLNRGTKVFDGPPERLTEDVLRELYARTARDTAPDPFERVDHRGRSGSWMARV